MSFENVLAVDTATMRLNLALLHHGDRSVQSSESVARTHGQIIMKKIDELFQSSGVAVGELQGIVVSLGPGSFTGLRIGLAAAKGIAVAGEIAIVGVTMFELVGARLRHEERPTYVVIPSRKDELYLGTYGHEDNAEPIVTIVSEAELSAKIGDYVVYTVGCGAEAFLSDHLQQAARRFNYDAMDLLRVGLNKLQARQHADLAALEPVYYQKAIAEIRFDRRRGEV
ncbi:MAG: tRNA (adenosine(37)-N6)-threonylcarbamoyltransferase complex dimerization subunit type 1 TsaB [Candidatus Zixiibacteriota bacterium]